MSALSNRLATGSIGSCSSMLRLQTFKRFAHCVGCGNELVLPLSRTKNFKAAPPNKLGTQVQDNHELDRIYNELSDAQRKALEWDQFKPESGSMNKHDLSRELKVAAAKKATKSTVCKPCVMAREGTISDIVIPETNNAFLGRVFHVIDALDFPLGVPKNITGSDVFVINRCDLIVSHESQLSKLKSYFMNTAFNSMGVTEDRVVLVSAAKKWHLSKLSELFVSRPKSNYFVGSTSAGKTSLAHELSGISQKHGSTTWPLPFTTQRVLTYKSLPSYRAKMLVDTPSLAEGSSALEILIPNVLRKVVSGTRMIRRDPKYVVPKIRAKTGQFVSIGGIVALEFPPLSQNRLPVHLFAGVGGLAHTEYGHAFRDLTKISEINTSVDPNHLKMRMHDHLGLELHRKFAFKPWLEASGVRQSVVVKNLGFLQPFLFGDFPLDYEISVWAPDGLDVGTRPEILPYLSN